MPSFLLLLLVWVCRPFGYQCRDGLEMQSNLRKSHKILLMSLFLLLSLGTGCSNVSSGSVKPQISVETDECILQHYDELPQCVQGALNQWLVLTR